MKFFVYQKKMFKYKVRQMIVRILIVYLMVSNVKKIHCHYNFRKFLYYHSYQKFLNKIDKILLCTYIPYQLSFYRFFENSVSISSFLLTYRNKQDRVLININMCISRKRKKGNTHTFVSSCRDCPHTLCKVHRRYK